MPSLHANLGLNEPRKGSLKFPNLLQCSPAIIKSAAERVKVWGINRNFTEAKPCGRWKRQPCHKICRIRSEAVPLEQSRAVQETSLQSGKGNLYRHPYSDHLEGDWREKGLVLVTN